MKIKWIGKYDGKNLPTVDVEVGAKKLPEVRFRQFLKPCNCSVPLQLHPFFLMLQ